MKRKLMLEARIGVEPMNKGFADLGLTTWLPRQESGIYLQNSALPVPKSNRQGGFSLDC
jgi:hypothetical protein